MMQIAMMSLLSLISGSIPFGYIISKKFYGIDITQKGSGNYGATNVLRVLGKTPGIITLILDVLKGFAPVYIGMRISQDNTLLPCIYGILAVLGHTFNPMFKLKGGKGVATALGVFTALAPISILSTLIVFLAVLFWTKYVSLGSILGAAAFAAATFVFYPSPVLRIFSVLTALIIIIKHHTNIKRLLNGTEIKFGVKKNEN